ncbi:ankyrin repeat and BTB/POZ domain-containing protein 1-like [Antedon mediterranea]|uniref:ankyrin repeat and BTB/POZ domain-containing protein 1-like n=1 Tax=Antedon mediterranea TaxID=105859 RepID=UPI003AF5231F
MGSKAELFLCCKAGDLYQVKYLLEKKEVDVNIRDTWDSTPLYYACLCGHLDVVRYLLDNGARCEAKTFDGERCIYGALTDEIRDVLKGYKAVNTGSRKRDEYQDFLLRALEGGLYEDIQFVIHDETYISHRCILATRCQYLAELLEGKWKHRNTIHIKHELVRPQAFQAILKYLYTGIFQIQLDCVEDALQFANKFQLKYLQQEIEEKLKTVYTFVHEKPGTDVNILCIETPNEFQSLKDDFQTLADMAMPALPNWMEMGLPFQSDLLPPFCDICFQVEESRFFCHKVFFCGRSDYFKGLLSNHFSELTEDDDCLVQKITLQGVSTQVFSTVVNYIYTNKVEISEDNSYEVLVTADMYLLSGLKRLCANEIGGHLTEGSVLTILRVAKMFNLVRLEDQCVEYMAKIVDKMVTNEDFAILVQEDAANVQEREEIDSIPIIDDMRHHISCNVQTTSAIADAQEKLNLLDKFLEQLDLIC